MSDIISVGDFGADDMAVELSIVMPCLNEAETLAICIRKAQSYLLRSRVSGEIVVGDNGSTDGSQQIAIDLGARVVPVPLRGYGAALFGAITAARGRYCIMGDSDDSYDFEHLDLFVVKLRAGYDLVMGNRFKGGIMPGAMPWKNRYIGNPVLSMIGKVLFWIKEGDFHCGLRGFSKDAFLKMDLRTTGMEFASEMVIKARLLGLHTTDVPTTLSPDGRSRPPHLLPYRDGWRHLRFMLLFSPNWLFLFPGSVLMIVGIFFGALLLPGPLSIAGVRFDTDTLIYCSFSVLIGFQAVVFSILSRFYASNEGLYPRTSNFSNMLGLISLERGLLLGGAFFLSGFLAALHSVFAWKGQHFGSMDFAALARWCIPAATGMALGAQIILFSLFFSTLEMGIRGNAAMISAPETDRNIT